MNITTREKSFMQNEIVEGEEIVIKVENLSFLIYERALEQQPLFCNVTSCHILILGVASIADIQPQHHRVAFREMRNHFEVEKLKF